MFVFFLGPHLKHMKVPRLGVESELQLPAYTTATATRDLSHICDLHHSSMQCRIHNPLREARDQTCVSWMLVRFISTEPRWELLTVVLICNSPVTQDRWTPFHFFLCRLYVFFGGLSIQVFCLVFNQVAHFLFFKFNFIGVALMYNVVLISGVQQSEPVMHT